MTIAIAFTVSITCSTWIFHKAYLNGLITNPDLNGVYVEMASNWYPEISSESDLWKVFSRSTADHYPESKEYPMAIYRKVDTCSDTGRLVVTKLPKDKLNPSWIDKKIVSKKAYSWGLAEIVKDNDNKQTEGVLTKPHKTSVLVREYGLFITVDDLSFLDDIVSINK